MRRRALVLALTALVVRAAALKAPIATSKFSAALVGDSLLAGLVERNSYEPVRDVVAARLAPKIYSPVRRAGAARPRAAARRGRPFASDRRSR